jgi:hypothetical protein
MLAIFIMRHKRDPDVYLHPGQHGIGALGGGPKLMMKNWVLETLLYFVLLSVAIGITTGILSAKLLRVAVKKSTSPKFLLKLG